MPASGQDPTKVEARTLYLYVNRARHVIEGGAGLDETSILARTLYLYVNRERYHRDLGGALTETGVLARMLYLYVNRAHDRVPSRVAGRALYTYVAYTDDEIFPWIERIVPSQQYRSGQVAIYGDGFGATEAAEGGIVRLGVYDPSQPGPGVVMGVVSWSSRSPGLHPANSGIRSSPAIVVTVPVESDSGMLSVELTT